MSRLSRPWALVAFASFCSGASLAAGIVVLATAPRAVEEAPHVVATAHSRPPLSSDAFEELRWHAALGNPDASGELATRLLDRFDAGSDKDDLYEAVQWIARDWDQPGYVRAGIVDRMVGQHCDRPVLKWHWLCGGGD